MMFRGRQALAIATWSIIAALGVAAGLATHRLWMFRSSLEALADRLTLDVGPQSTLIYDDDNNLVSALFEQHRIGVGLDEMSPDLVQAVLVTEDRRFFDHDGVDLRRILAAFVANQRAGSIVQGGSTITQQLVRSFLLDREKSYQRKLKEAILARRLEERYSKRDILESYLNRVYFGDGYYGVEAAAIGYFGKPVAKVDVAEAATLAGLIKGPSVYSPTKNPDAARERRDLVLTEMHADGMLNDQEFQRAVSVPVQSMLARGDKTGVVDPRHSHGAEYFRDAVTRELVARFGSEAVYTGGLRVYTTLDRDLQRLAEAVIASRLDGFGRGGRDPLQGALVAIDPRTGYVEAVVGGRGFHETPFNRALDAHRQPGSAFKPFIYALALESGYSPGTQIQDLDQPIPTRQGPWLPDGEHEGPMVTLRTGLALSSNRAAAHLLQEVGVNRTLDLAQRFGIRSPLPAVPALALGTGEVTLLELTSAYGVFANRGVWKAPTMIRSVVDRYGREIYRAEDTERHVISEATSFLMTSMMSDVLNYGTAASARAQGFRMRAAGKTGTSQDYTDAWFVGFTPSLVSGVWFGYDTPKPIMDRGFASVVAVPAWARFMMGAMRGVKDQWYDAPGSLTKVRLCKISGLLAGDKCDLPVYEMPPYDPNHPDVVTAAAPIVREGGVYEDYVTSDRIPPLCNLPHGVDLAAPPSYYDPALTTPAYQRTYTTPSAPPRPPLPPPSVPSPAASMPMPAPAVPAALPPMSRPAPAPRVVTPPPPFMTEKPAPAGTVVPTTVDKTPPAPPPAAPAIIPAPKPEPTPKPDAAKPATEREVENPLIPRANPTPAAPSPFEPIVPGAAKVNRSPPGPPPPRPPGGDR